MPVLEESYFLLNNQLPAYGFLHAESQLTYLFFSFFPFLQLAEKLDPGDGCP